MRISASVQPDTTPVSVYNVCTKHNIKCELVNIQGTRVAKLWSGDPT
jgi:hypothetical protein